MLRFTITLVTGGAAVAVALAALTLPATPVRADHAPPGFSVVNAPTATTVNSGGEGATWELFTSLTSGNPHTDLDFFRVDGDYYVAAGTLALGPNVGGQVIYRLTAGGQLNPGFVSAHGSAACITDATQATALQHDVEVTPKGDVLFNTDWGGRADTRNAQLLLDATDGPGRCHDQGPLTAAAAFDEPPGGIEIVDITDLANPVEIHLTSHIGEAHTVNVDPKRAHIAYAVTADSVTIANRPDEEDPNRSEQTDLDGFEVLDLSSCMNFPDGTDIQTKRETCRPEVYRYRFEPDWARGTFGNGATGGCHELEIYPDDKLACASLSGTILFDMAGAFDDNGTPEDFTDDTPRGQPLPCSVRRSVSNEAGAFATDALVTDCVLGVNGEDLTLGGWIKLGSPSLAGVELMGFVNHNGRTLSNSAVDSRPPSVDIAVSHEAELTHSGRFLIATDERGGGVVPPDASCPTPGTNAGNESGNGGMHAYAVDRLFTVYPGDPASDDPETIASAADAAYARNPAGEKAIYRATPRVSGETFCTAHVLQQIPGQNRIFMGWYTQGTQVVDYIENADGTFEWKEAAWWVPEGGTQWTSHIFTFQDNGDGTFTYWGAASDITRTSVDVYMVTLPAPPQSQPVEHQPEPMGQLPQPSRSFSRGGGAAGTMLLVLALAGLGGRRLWKHRHASAKWRRAA